MKELFGIPIVMDDRCVPGEVYIYPIERTCKCDPATLVRIVFFPQPGVQCACGAVWPMADKPEVR